MPSAPKGEERIRKESKEEESKKENDKKDKDIEEEETVQKVVCVSAVFCDVICGFHQCDISHCGSKLCFETRVLSGGNRATCVLQQWQTVDQVVKTVCVICSRWVQVSKVIHH